MSKADHTLPAEVMQAEKDRRLLSTLGLCRRAGGLIFGTDMVCEAMRNSQKTVLAVVEASDTSDNTHKRLVSKCTYYKVPHHRLSITTEALGHAIGKTGVVAAVAVTHEGLLKSLEKYLPEASVPEA